MEEKCIFEKLQEGAQGKKASLTNKFWNKKEPAKSEVKGAVEYAKSEWDLILNHDCVKAYFSVPTPDECPIHKNAREPGTNAENSEAEIAGKVLHETAISEAISKNLQAFEPGLKIIEHQHQLKSGRRVDILCQDATGDIVAIEVKKENSSDALNQLLEYMVELSKEHPEKKLKGVVMSNSYDEMLASKVKFTPDVSLKYYRIKVEPVSKEGVAKP